MEEIMDEILKLYKLIILYMLSRVDFPLTTSQISEFALNKEYMTYFRLTQSLSELAETGLVLEEVTHSRTFYHLTEEGNETIHFFKKDISPEIRADIDAFLKQKKYDLKNEISVKSDYQRTSEGDYLVCCQVIEHKTPLIELRITAPDKTEAETISNNWQKKNQEIYAKIMGELL